MSDNSTPDHSGRSSYERHPVVRRRLSLYASSPDWGSEEARYNCLRSITPFAPTYREAVRVAVKYGLVGDVYEYEDCIEYLMR